ncbi:MAG: ATP-binding protein, partial [Bacillota bacterium]
MVTAFPFVGRTQEQAALLAHIQAAAAGSGGLLLVGGEAGAGKTTLLRTVISTRPSVSVTGRCPGPDETPPFGPWAEAVQRLSRELGWETAHLPQPFGESPSRMSAYELAGALAHWLGQSGQPLVLAVEDLHWADEASLALLRHLPSWLADWPVLVVGTYRTDELSRQHPLWHLLPEVQRAGANRILLERLSRSEVAELLAQTLPPELNDETVAGQVHERTAGLALFVRELIDPVIRTRRLPGPESPLPQTLQQAIDSKLDRLPPEAVAVLEPAAVIGERFSFDLLAEVTEMAEDALSEALEAAVARHVIRPQDTTGGWFAFDHALYRESLLSRQIGARRRKWHARIAAALLAAPEPDLDAAAYHLARAGDPRAAEYLLAAGDRARALGALAQARDRYEQALSQLPPSHPGRPELLLKLAWCWRWDDPARAAATCDEALSTAVAAGDQEVALWVRHLMLVLARSSNDTRFLEHAADVIAAEEAMLANPRYQRLELEL